MPIVHLMLMLLKQEHKRIVHKNIPRKNVKYRAVCLLIRARDWQEVGMAVSVSTWYGIIK